MLYICQIGIGTLIPQKRVNYDLKLEKPWLKNLGN